MRVQRLNRLGAIGCQSLHSHPTFACRQQIAVVRCRNSLANPSQTRRATNEKGNRPPMKKVIRFRKNSQEAYTEEENIYRAKNIQIYMD